MSFVVGTAQPRTFTKMAMVMSWYIKGTLLDTTNRSFVSTVTLFLFFLSTNILAPAFTSNLICSCELKYSGGAYSSHIMCVTPTFILKSITRIPSVFGPLRTLPLYP